MKVKDGQGSIGAFTEFICEIEISKGAPTSRHTTFHRSTSDGLFSLASTNYETEDTRVENPDAT